MSKKVIRKVEEFVVANLGKISVATAINPDLAKEENVPSISYEGFTLIGIPMPNGQISQIPLEFSIDNVNSLEEAFDVFQERAKVKFQEFAEQAREAQKPKPSDRLVTATSVPPITREDGKPFMRIVE